MVPGIPAKGGRRRRSVSPTYPDITAGILVGGRGVRLGGVDKARLRRADERSYLQHIVGSLTGLVGEVVLLGRSEQRYAEVDCRLLADQRDSAGPLAGLESLLLADSAPWVLLLACDLPRFDSGLVHALAAERDADLLAVVAQTRRGLEPTCALYAAALHDQVSAALDAGERALHRLVERIPHRRVAMAGELESALTNVNLPQDLR